MADTLLIEILTEELPPKSLARLSEAFSNHVYHGLKDNGFVRAHSDPQPFATPRRLAVLIPEVLAKQPDRVVERRGPAVSAGLDAAGKPTAALLGFARSCDVKPSALERLAGEKGEHFVYRAKQKGEPLKDHLSAIVEASLKRLPAAKLMRWGDGEAQFVRPVHGLVMRHGNKTVPGQVLGLKSGHQTQGHRFLSRGAVAITHAKDYERLLERRGKVIAGFYSRVKQIETQLDKQARKIGRAVSWNLNDSAALIEEVASLVEYPVVYVGEFSAEFLKIPKECLVISMQQHQRYFPLIDNKGKLLNRFLFVSNIKTGAPKHIIRGNERVLKARLADAKFFFDQDKKTSLATRTSKLGSVVYHNKLGSQLERVERVKKLAVKLAAILVAAQSMPREETEATERAAFLCKADLLTDMVGEFPELQGIMGRYYALHDGESPTVARAIEQHYFPRTGAGELPDNRPAICVSLADKCDALVGIYGLGLIPTGEKDPFGLRRQALGVARILMEKSLPLEITEILQLAYSRFPTEVLAENVAADLYGFILERLKPYLRERDFLPDEIDAVLSLRPSRLDQILPRLTALQKFRELPEAKALAAANKRIFNILRQAGLISEDGQYMAQPAIDAALSREVAERELAQALALAASEVSPLFLEGRYTEGLKRLARLREPIDKFFDQVMVMVDDEYLRSARLGLLGQVHALFVEVADISRLQS
jgi:glycyl-tRNA synthetase beta chain